jgi:hypothetical protein
MKRARRAIAAADLMLGIIEINVADFLADAGQQRSIGSQSCLLLTKIADPGFWRARKSAEPATGMNIGLPIRCYITKPLI